MVLLALYMFNFCSKKTLPEYSVEQNTVESFAWRNLWQNLTQSRDFNFENLCQKSKYLFNFYNKATAAAPLDTAVISILLTLIRLLLSGYAYTANRNHIKTFVLTQILQWIREIQVRSYYRAILKQSCLITWKICRYQTEQNICENDVFKDFRTINKLKSMVEKK